ncbi:MAG TPA: FAD-dependent oxidoreductase [Candidatus Dormibacteraeota bacterium]|nr:FAD-dependent oxidoreductase [Candidatus Dormibacteraeota bacterium]
MTEAAPLQTSEEPSRCPRPVNYEILVIGSGEAGKYLAWTMAGEGHRSAVVERKLIGRSCMNIACLPSKNIIHAAKVRSFTMRAAEFGVELESAVTSVEGVQARKRAMVDGLIQLQLDRFPGQRG